MIRKRVDIKINYKLIRNPPVEINLSNFMNWPNVDTDG